MSESSLGSNDSDYSDDVVTIATPEGVDLQLSLAGFGTRCLAALVDFMIQLAILLILGVFLALVSWATSADVATWIFAALIVLIFLIQTGYHVLFEVLSGGRSPGKRLAGCRVVRADGSAITLTASLIRNLVRVVDSLFSFLVGAIAVLVTPRNQRLGDLAAGTLVVRDAKGRSAPTKVHVDPALAAEGAGWDLTGVTNDEVAVVRSFLERRESLDPQSRQRIGEDLARRLGPSVVGAPPNQPPERLLEVIVAAKTAGR